jgi:hypothetical protein
VDDGQNDGLGDSIQAMSCNDITSWTDGDSFKEQSFLGLSYAGRFDESTS